MQKPNLTIITPALNEETNIVPAIESILATLDNLNIDGEILVVNDGSRDSTPSLVKTKIKESPSRIRILNHATPQGIGASFWDGVDNAKGEFVVMLPGDNENDPKEILRHIDILKDVDMVIPYVSNKQVRSRTRNIFSAVYRFIINCTFFTSLKYTNGTVLFRKSLLKKLDKRIGSFFYQTDILIRLIKDGYPVKEVPYKLKIRKAGKSKALSLRSLKEVMKGYLGLVKDIYVNRRKK